MSKKLSLAGSAALLFVFLGVGCDQTPTVAPIPSPTASESADLAPQAGAQTAAVRSADGLWSVHTLYTSGEQEEMVLEGPSGSRTMAASEPVGFSPDGTLLLFVSAPDDLADGLYALPLRPLGTPRRLTNVDQRASDPPSATFVPTPVDGQVQWSGQRATYSVPGDGTFTIDLDTGEVQRGTP